MHAISVVHSLCRVQGLPVRELLQLQFKIVRDKSIKEAMLFGLYFAVFLLIAFQVRVKYAVRHPRVTPRSLQIKHC